MAVEQHRTFCRVCIASCGLVVDVDGDQVVAVRGDRDHPLSHGYACSKGRALPDLHHHPRRLTAPQQRVDGELVEQGWDDVLDDLGERLRGIVEESGPGAVGIFLGGGGYSDRAGFLARHRFARALGTPSLYSDNTIDAIAKMWVSEMVCGIGSQMPQPDHERARMVLYIGINPVVSHGHATVVPVPADYVRDLAKQGEVWVMDPRRTETATLATRHLSPRPNSDYAVLAFLVRELLVEGADHEHLAAHAQDVDRLTAAVEPFTLERAVAESGLAADELTDLLAAIRRAGRLTVETGTGVGMQRECNLVVWLSWVLMIVTGSLDREGGAWVNPGMLGRMDRRSPRPLPPEGSRQPGPPSRPELSSLCGEYPCAALPDEVEAGNLRAVVCVGGNMVAALPETGRVVPALEGLEVLACIDVVGNATTDLATHVLPAKDQLERPDLTAIVDMGFPYLAAQYADAVVEPVGEVRSYWWIVAQLGARMGIEVFPGLDLDSATDHDVLGMLPKSADRTLDQLLDGDFHQDHDLPIGWLQRYVDEHVGGWRVAPQEMVDQLAAMEPTAPLVALSRRMRRHMNAKLTDHDTKVILVNGREASKAGVAAGQRATVRSASGSVVGVVELDETLPDGVLNVPHGWDDEFNVNRLTSSTDVDPYTGMVWYSGFPVELEPAP